MRPKTGGALLLWHLASFFHNNFFILSKGFLKFTNKQNNLFMAGTAQEKYENAGAHNGFQINLIS